MESMRARGRGLREALLLIAGLAATACGGATTGEPAGGTGASAPAPALAATDGGDTASPDGAPSSGPCGGLSPGGPMVTIQNLATNAPAATGGTILPGTYDLTLDVFHLGEGADPSATTATETDRAETIEVTFGAYKTATTDAKGVSYESGTYSDDGAQLTMRARCPVYVTPTSLTFSATRDEIRLFRGLGCVEELVFRRRAGS